ncbi:MAG: right-handed parallel beta-helix repeat-containing protein [Armatimonadetes bacterium]|nr:right-handed parallel beta-helix repeat-containing protein [Armatimonadota bacterium]
MTMCTDPCPSLFWMLTLLFLCALCHAQAPSAGTIFVDQRHPQADDTNPGTPAAPLKTISAAAALAEPGATVYIRSGIYRERVLIEKNGTADAPIRFEASPAANVIVTGADAITELRHEEEPGVFSAPWPYVFIGWSPNRAHPDDAHHAMVGRAEQVFVRGYPLHQVLERAHLSRGSFYVDQSNKRLFVRGKHGEDLTKVLVEASVRDVVWDVQGEHVRTRGIRFRYAANRAQSGAVVLRKTGDVLEDCVVERMNSIGATFTGPNMTVRRCTFQDNGQMGFSAGSAHNLLFTGCLVRNNNTKDWARGWEAGGNKLVLCRGVVLENSRFLENRGNGIWFDIGNEDCVVRNCLIADNEDCGIFYEISYGLRAHDNVIVGNGLTDTPGAWGAQAAISLSSSPGCVIERNIMVGNREGFNFREQGRTTPRIGKSGPEEPVWNHDQTVRNNIIAYNRDAQTWGWFDVLDERHFPQHMQRKPADLKQGEPVGMMGEMQIDETGRPVNLVLDQLNFKFSSNLYDVAAGQELFNWGCAWRHNVRYSDLEKVRVELGLEQGSVQAPFQFADYLTRDFRVPADSPALKMDCYPHGEVPGVVLGTLE